MLAVSITLQSISCSRNMRMGLAFAKESHALFLKKYSPCCAIRLKEVCEIEKGRSISEDNTRPGEIPVVAGGKGFAYYHDTSNRRGNIITVSASGASSGFVNYWKQPIWASDCITVKSKDENIFITKFIYHLLKIVQSDIFLLQKGADQPHVYSDDIGSILLPEVAINTQRMILTDIEKYETAIDELQRQLISVQEIIDSVFAREFSFDYATFNEVKADKEFFTRIGSFSNNSDLRFSAKFHRKAGSYVMGQLTNITDKKIKHFISEPIMLGASISPNDFDESGSAYYVSMATIKTLDVELDETQLVSDKYFRDNISKSLQKDDIILARSGVAIGKTAIVKEPINGIFADFTMRIRIDATKCIPEFAYYYFRSTYFQYLIEVYKKGLQNQNIFPLVIQEFPMIDISLGEQQRIVNEIHSEIAKQDEIKSKIAELRSQIDTIIEETIAGGNQENG